MVSSSDGAAEAATTTEFGLAIEPAFARPATEEQLQRAAAGMRARGLTVEIVDTLAQAHALVLPWLPTDATIFTATSETVRESGLAGEIDGSGRYRSVRAQMTQLDPRSQARDRIRLTATPDVLVGSAHAVTADGELFIASATGSQIGPISAGAGRVILLVGAQKVVADRAAAARRLEFYALPKEDIRARAAYGRGSVMAKTLIVSRDPVPGRTTVVLIRQAVGF